MFINHHGRRRAKMIGDKETAHTVARRIRERLTLGDLSLLTSEPAESFETYAARWLTAGESARKASTHRFYAFNLTLHIKPTLGARPISAITRADCRELLAACRQKGLKRASLLGVQRTLSAVLSQAVEDQILAANPAFRMGKHMRMGDEPKPEIQPLTHVEAFDFLVAVTERMPEQYAFFLCALRTGMRLGELLALQWGDVDFAGRFLEVRRSLVSGRLTTTKNTNRRRVDMSLKLAEGLRDHQRAAKPRASRRGASCRRGSSRRRRVDTSTATTCAIGCSIDSSSRRACGRFGFTTAAHIRVPADSERRAADLRERADGAQLDPGDGGCRRALGAEREPRGGGSAAGDRT